MFQKFKMNKIQLIQIKSKHLNQINKISIVINKKIKIVF